MIRCHLVRWYPTELGHRRQAPIWVARSHYRQCHPAETIPMPEARTPAMSSPKHSLCSPTQLRESVSKYAESHQWREAIALLERTGTATALSRRTATPLHGVPSLSWLPFGEELIAQLLWYGDREGAYQVWRHLTLSLCHRACQQRAKENTGMPSVTSSLVLQLSLYAVVVDANVQTAEDVLRLLVPLPRPSAAETLAFSWLRSVLAAAAASASMDTALHHAVQYVHVALPLLEKALSDSLSRSREANALVVLTWRLMHSLHVAWRRAEGPRERSGADCTLQDILAKRLSPSMVGTKLQTWLGLAEVMAAAMGPLTGRPLTPSQCLENLRGMKEQMNPATVDPTKPNNRTHCRSSHQTKRHRAEPSLQGMIVDILLRHHSILHRGTVSLWQGTAIPVRSSGKAPAPLAAHRRLSEYRFLVGWVLPDLRLLPPRRPGPAGASLTRSCSNPSFDSVYAKAKRSSNKDSIRRLHAVIDAGDWAAALRHLPIALADSIPLHRTRKGISTCLKAKPNPGAAWRGAWVVWEEAKRQGLVQSVVPASNCSPSTTGTPREGLSVSDVGRLVSILAHGHRWVEALQLYEVLPDALVDPYIICQVAYSLRMGGAPDRVIDLWAHWRCRVGDKVDPTAEMTTHLLHAGLFGSPEALQCATVLLLTAVRHGSSTGQGGSQTSPSPSLSTAESSAPLLPGTLVPLPFERNEAVIERILRDRWYTKSWQTALTVALGSGRHKIAQTVAQCSPPRREVFEAIRTALQTTREEDMSEVAMPLALAHHVATRRRVKLPTPRPHRPQVGIPGGLSWDALAQEDPGSAEVLAAQRKQTATEEQLWVEDVLGSLLGKEA